MAAVATNAMTMASNVAPIVMPMVTRVPCMSRGNNSRMAVLACMMACGPPRCARAATVVRPPAGFTGADGVGQSRREYRGGYTRPADLRLTCGVFTADPPRIYRLFAAYLPLQISAAVFVVMFDLSKPNGATVCR
ncbi:hypothetical protein JCM10599A_58250 [Paraburkholderia kururiensis]